MMSQTWSERNVSTSTISYLTKIYIAEVSVQVIQVTWVIYQQHL